MHLDGTTRENSQNGPKATLMLVVLCQGRMDYNMNMGCRFEAQIKG